MTHQWRANPAGANDVFYAVEAAQKAWSELSKEFVVMGHSQGGGVAWASAVRQAQIPVEGYLGSITGSPTTDLNSILVEPLSEAGSIVVPLCQTIASIFPEFEFRIG